MPCWRRRAWSRAELEQLLDEGPSWVADVGSDKLADAVMQARARAGATESEPAVRSVFQKWIWARSVLAAEDAEHDKAVHWFRGEYLADGLVPADEVPAWIEARVEEATRYIRVAAPVDWELGQAFTVSKEMIDGYSIDILVYAKDGWQETRPVQRNSVLDHLRVVAQRNSVLDHLRVVADNLSKRYPWQPAQAVAFVLSGINPLAQTLRTTTSHRWPAGHRVSIDADPDVPAVEVERVYSKLRKETRGPRARIPQEKALDLVIFAAEHPSSDAVTMRSDWNHSRPEARCSSARSFRQALRDAVRRVAGQRRPQRRHERELSDSRSGE